MKKISSQFKKEMENFIQANLQIITQEIKEMATCSNILAWRIPWTEEPDRLQSIGSQRVRHNWNNLAYMQCSESSEDYSAPWRSKHIYVSFWDKGLYIKVIYWQFT